MGKDVGISKERMKMMSDYIFGNKYKADALVIYHRSDLDGVCSAAIVFDHYFASKGRMVDLFGWTYGDPLPENIQSIGVESGKTRIGDIKTVVVCDVSFGKDTERFFKEWEEQGIEVIWIDHHKTAIFDEYGSEILPGIKGVRKIGKAACELTYEYFNPGEEVPMSVQYLSAYDVWDKDRFSWHNIMAFQYGMRARCGLDVIAVMETVDNEKQYFEGIVDSGWAILSSNKSRNKSQCNEFSFEGRICGCNAICMNTLEFNSTTFDSVYDENKHDFMMPFAILPNGKVRFSLYSTKEDCDCSAVAKKFGGGGHKGASGFILGIEDEVVVDFFKTHEINV